MLTYSSPAPKIVGSSCHDVLAQEYWHEGKCVTNANVLFLHLSNGEWHRIALDCGLIFWRVESQLHIPVTDPSHPERGAHPVVDVGVMHGLVGCLIEGIRLDETATTDDLLIEFQGGVTLVLSYQRDIDMTMMELRRRAA